MGLFAIDVLGILGLHNWVIIKLDFITSFLFVIESWNSPLAIIIHRLLPIPSLIGI